jgi:hypothetical protein
LLPVFLSQAFSMSDPSCGADPTERVLRKRQQLKEYYRLNRERILAKQKEINSKRHYCDCGATVAASRREVHEASSKHIRYVESRKEVEALSTLLREQRLFAAQQLQHAAAFLATDQGIMSQ